MNSFIMVLLALAGPSVIYSLSLPMPAIGGDLFSTARIVKEMCLGNVNDTTAQAFWDCYNVAPGIEVFEKCQMKVSGYLLNSAENFTKKCKTLYTFPKYALCLKREFSDAGIDMGNTLDLVNKCEAQVLGIE